MVVEGRDVGKYLQSPLNLSLDAATRVDSC